MPKKKLNKELEKKQSQLDHINNLLDESNEILNNYIDVSKTDLEGNIIYVSQMFCDTMGYTKEELIGVSHNIVKSPFSNEKVYKKLWEKISQDKSYSGTMQNKAKDGSLVWFEVLIKPDFDEDGEKIGYTAYRKNITEKKLLQELVTKQIEEIRQKDQQIFEQTKITAMGNMIHNIAHQWRQPLSLISTVASGLSLKLELDMFDKEEAIENLNKLNSSAQFLSNTIEDFRRFFQKEKDESQFRLLDVLDLAVSSQMMDITTSNIQIVEDYNDTQTNIFGYKNGLEQVFVNIIRNSIEVLETKAYKKYIFVNVEKKKNKVIVTIRDNAGGIPNTIIDNILEPYFTTKHQSQGTGLGLYMVNEIITKHFKGNITVTNDEVTCDGQVYTGAKFKISIPINI